jgi:ureidoglycolate hydrolase
MNENWLEIREYLGEGYKPLVDYGAWRVAILRFIDELLPERIDRLERHCQTDEVFVLLAGSATLLVGGSGASPEGLFTEVLIPGKLYNVKMNVWHSTLLSREASILIVENRDTGEGNSEFWPLTPGQRRQVVELGKAVGFEYADWQKN